VPRDVQERSADQRVVPPARACVTAPARQMGRRVRWARARASTGVNRSKQRRELRSRCLSARRRDGLPCVGGFPSGDSPPHTELKRHARDHPVNLRTAVVVRLASNEVFYVCIDYTSWLSPWALWPYFLPSENDRIGRMSEPQRFDLQGVTNRAAFSSSLPECMGISDTHEPPPRVVVTPCSCHAVCRFGRCNPPS
jgi:hypothetical protein